MIIFSTNSFFPTCITIPISSNLTETARTHIIKSETLTPLGRARRWSEPKRERRGVLSPLLGEQLGKSFAEAPAA